MSRTIDQQDTLVGAGSRRRLGVKRVAIASLLLLPLSLGIAGCISSSSPSPPASTTVVVPSGSTAVCADGTAPPCR
jgi:hypothetical protein